MHAIKTPRVQVLLPVLAAVAALLLVAVFDIGQVAIIRKAAGIDEKAEGLGGFVDTCNALVTPALVAAAAATPLATIGGGIAMAFGARRGLQIVVTSLGILALLGSVKGIVG